MGACAATYRLDDPLSSDVRVSTADYLYTSPDDPPFVRITFRLDTPIEAAAHGCWHLLDLTDCFAPADSVAPCPAHEQHDQKITHLIWHMYLESHGRALPERDQELVTKPQTQGLFGQDGPGALILPGPLRRCPQPPEAHLAVRTLPKPGGLWPAPVWQQAARAAVWVAGPLPSPPSFAKLACCSPIRTRL